MFASNCEDVLTKVGWTKVVASIPDGLATLLLEVILVQAMWPYREHLQLHNHKL